MNSTLGSVVPLAMFITEAIERVEYYPFFSSMILDKNSMTHHDVAERGNGHRDQPDNDYGNRECDGIPDVDGNSDCDDDPERIQILTMDLILSV